MKSLRLALVLCLVALLLWEPVQARKSRGGSSRGSGKPSRGSSRRQPAPAPAPAPSPNLNHGGLASLSYPGYNSPPARKPSAPELPKQDTRPVGWNVNNKDTSINKNVAHNAHNTPTNNQPAPAYPAGGGLSGQNQGSHGYPAGSGLSGQSGGAPAYPAGGGLSGAQPGHAAPAYPAGSGLSGAGGQGGHAYPASGGLSGAGSHGYPAGGAAAQPAYPAGSGLSGAGQHGYPASTGLSGAGNNKPPAYSPGYNNPPAYQPHNQAGYSNVGNPAYNRGPPAPGYGGAAPGYGGYGGAGGYGGYGGGGYGGSGGGAFPGYGGMGGFGGGYGGMGYGHQKPGFLSGNKFGLILAGLAVWNLARSGSRTTHNHYHNTYNNADPAHPMPAENVTDPVLGELTNCTLTITNINETSVIRIPCVIATSFAPNARLGEDANKPLQGDQPGALNCTITVVTKNGTEVKTDISCEELSNLAPKNVTIPDDPLADPVPPPPQVMNCVNRLDPNGQPCGPAEPNINMGEAPLSVIPLEPVAEQTASPAPEGPTSTTTVISMPAETAANTTPVPA